MTNSMLKSFTRAFSLIEMMIVIGIIAILAGLTLGISNAVLRGSEIRKTEDAITLLDTALQEWETEMGRSITFHGIAAIVGRYDIPYLDVDPVADTLSAPNMGAGDVTQEAMSEAMLNRSKWICTLLNESEASKNILKQIHPDLLMTETVDEIKIFWLVDAWENPIGCVFAGRTFNGSGLTMFAEDQSGDLTVRDQAEDGLGSCINRRPYFVSSGPDGKWGYRYQAYLDGSNNVNNADDLDKWSDCIDNIYSYEPFLVEEAR